MARYIDADAYIKYCEEHWIPLNVDAVKAQPSADVVEVVRCNDCVYYKCLTIMGSKPLMMCSVFNWQSKPDDFCSNAIKIMEVIK